LPACAEALAPWAVVVVAALPTGAKAGRLGSELLLVSPVAGAAVTVRLTEVLCVALVAVPVIVRVYVPGAAVPAPTVSVELPPAVTEAGLSVAVAPAGAPLTVRFTVSAEPLVTAVEMVDVPFAPCTSERLAGLALT